MGDYSENNPILFLNSEGEISLNIKGQPCKICLYTDDATPTLHPTLLQNFCLGAETTLVMASTITLRHSHVLLSQLAGRPLTKVYFFPPFVMSLQVI